MLETLSSDFHTQNQRHLGKTCLNAYAQTKLEIEAQLDEILVLVSTMDRYIHVCITCLCVHGQYSAGVDSQSEQTVVWSNFEQ